MLPRLFVYRQKKYFFEPWFTFHDSTSHGFLLDVWKDMSAYIERYEK